MNIERLRAVRDAILNPPEGYGFYMGAFASAGHSCGTAFCIAGWTLHQANRSAREISNMPSPEHEAMALLELTSDQANELFFPSDEGWQSIPAQAAATIDRLIETGEVVWDVPA